MTPRRPDGEVGDTHLLGLARVALGLALFAIALDDARSRLVRGPSGDAFRLAFVPDAWLPSPRALTALLAVRLAAATLATIGIRARLALFVSAALGLAALALDRLAYRDDRFVACVAALLLALSPCASAWLISGATPAALSRGPYWAARLAQLELVLVYVASFVAAARDADFRSGLVLADRLARLAPFGYGVGEALIPAAAALSLLALATLLFLAVGLWIPRTRMAALYVGVWFHIAIAALVPNGLFPLVAAALYVPFATPDTAVRKLYFDPSRPKGVVYAKLVGALDWLGRFEIRGWSPDAKRGHTIVVVRRDGTRATGVRALAMVTRCVPLLFPLWAPLALIASFTKGGETSSRA